jgi:hypothetical protein
MNRIESNRMNHHRQKRKSNRIESFFYLREIIVHPLVLYFGFSKSQEVLYHALVALASTLASVCTSTWF